MKRVLTFFAVICIAALCLFSSCSKTAPENNGLESEITGKEETDSVPETEEETEAETEEETQPPETEPTLERPEIIKAPTWAVIVGKVGRDDKGWFLTLEEPIDVEYSHSDGTNEGFEELTRLGMPESSVDGIDKSVYLGSVITVEGQIELFTQREKALYIVPQNIKMGKCAEFSHPLSEQPQIDTNEDKYDVTLGLPEKMNVVLKDGHYTYNPYMLSAETLRYMGNGFAEFYVDFVDAYINYEESCYCPEKQYALMLSTVLFYECPVFEADGIFEYVTDYDEMTDTVNIRYKNEKEEHDRLVSEFLSEADKFFVGVTPEMSEHERARNLYHALCSAVKYDYDALKKLNKNNPYYAYATKSGVCITFANTYLQMLTQVGIENTAVPGQMVNGEAHVWTLMRIDGKNYFCDPTFETGRNEGNGYIFFGLTYAERTKSGTGKKGMGIGRYVQQSIDDVEISPTPLE